MEWEQIFLYLTVSNFSLDIGSWKEMKFSTVLGKMEDIHAYKDTHIYLVVKTSCAKLYVKLFKMICIIKWVL